MGKFLPNDQELIDLVTEEYTQDALANYSEMLGNSPTYLSYFNLKATASSQDKNLDAVYQVLGSESPVRFNRIDNFPVYGLQQISLDLSEGLYGVEAEINTEVIILPSTIIPFTDDFVSIHYIDSSSGISETKFVLFRVTKVDKSVLGSTRFYKLQISMTAEDIEQAEEQTVQELEFNVTDYESNRQAILDKSSVKVIKVAKALRQFLSEDYIEMFNDQPVSSVSCPHLNGKLVCYNLNYFIEMSECFKFDRSFLNTLSVLYQPDLPHFRLIKIGFPSCILEAFLHPSHLSKILGEGFEPINSNEMIHNAYRTSYYSTNTGCGSGSATTLFPAEGIWQHMLDKTFFETDDKKLEDVLIKYVTTRRTESFNKKEMVDDIKAAIETILPIVPSYRNFYLVPVLAFILKDITDIFTLESRRYGG